MPVLYNVLLVVLIVVSVAMIVLILMQQGKGADAGAAFGSGASGTVFGSRGSANFLSRTTAILATIFFLTALGLAYMVADRKPSSGSIMQRVAPAEVQQDAPAAPANSDVPPAPAANTANSDVPPAAPAETQPAAATESKDSAQKDVQEKK